MHSPDTSDVLVYNDEIYNSPELHRELQQAGFTFRGHGDTEVFPRAYQHGGPHFRGTEPARGFIIRARASFRRL